MKVRQRPDGRHKLRFRRSQSVSSMLVYLESSYLEDGIDLGLSKRPVQFVIHGPRITFPDLAGTRNALSNGCTDTQETVNVMKG